MVNRTSSPSSSLVKITVSSTSKGIRGIISMGLTTPISHNSNSPVSGRGNKASNGGNNQSNDSKFVSMLKDEVVEENNTEFVSYTVHIHPTSDHQSNSDSQTALPEDNANIRKRRRRFNSGTIFTGRYNSMTRGHVIESLANPTESIKLGLVCGMKGCNEKALEGKTMVPCDCGFNICRDCYLECVGNGGGYCLACKESYTSVNDDEAKDQALPFKNKGTYDHGNVVWSKDGYGFGSSANGIEHPPVFGEKSRRALTWKVPVSPTILIPYRLLIIIRLVVLGFFLIWRFRNPNHEAMWLWRISNTCELWFGLSWLLDQLPKLCLVNRATDLSVLKDRFESPNLQNPEGQSDLPGIDVFVSTADPEKEPPLVTANTVLSILAVDYPVEKLACYLSDDAGSLLTFEALAETASFARIWVPFCRKHEIEPRNPEAYFKQKHDFLKNDVRLDFAGERERVKREYDEFKVRIHSLPESIRKRSDSYNAYEEHRAKMKQTKMGDNPLNEIKISKVTWMFDGSYWPGTWEIPGEANHSRGDHAGIIQVMLASSNAEPTYSSNTDGKNSIDTTDVDIRLPMLVYVSREKRSGYDDNKKAGAMNALLRTSAIMSNGPFILNLDCDHYIYNSLALKEGICFMLDKGGDRICYVQFPQRFDGIDPNDRYANHNTIFFDVTMRALDGLQGPMYVGTCCIFRRTALYGFSPARATEHHGLFGTKKTKLLLRKSRISKKENDEMAIQINRYGQDSDDDNANIESLLFPKRFGNTTSLASSIPIASIPIAEFQGRLIQELQISKGNQVRPTGSLSVLQEPLDVATIAKVIDVISCIYEDKTEWGKRVGWIYGSITEDVVTGYKMHNRGWRSVYCITKCDAFRGTAPINLTDRLHQVLRWATGSIEILFSRNNPLFATHRMKFLQKVAYFNAAVYPFTSLVLVVYCFLPAVSLFSGQFMVQPSVTFLIFELVIVITLYLLIILETKWSGITVLDWWRDEQFWLIGGTSAYPTAVLQGLVKVIAKVDISFTLTSKSAAPEDGGDEFADLYMVKWSFLMIPPITIILVNMIAIAVGIARALYSPYPNWSKLVGGVFFSFWVLCHLYPFAKGLMGRCSRVVTIFYVWSGLLSIIILLLCVYIRSSSGTQNHMKFQFP